MSLGAQSPGMWEVLGAAESPSQAWKHVFGEHGERGEYMDGYSEMAMTTRCQEDYKWEEVFDSEDFSSERANMMSHLYNNEQLWVYTNMVAFADHYVLNPEKPFETFLKQKESRPEELPPIFGGVVWKGWEDPQDNAPTTFSEAGIDYVRMECNFGMDEDIGGASNLANSPHRERFCQLAQAAKACQDSKMVPLILLQFPWRDPDISVDYFRSAVTEFASALNEAGVASNQLLFETRPPIGLSAQEERGMSGSERVKLGYDTGTTMFEIFKKAFSNPIAGFCVAGGSTKGDNPTAMEDDTQNAVRQGIRECARTKWNFDFCFWEMGAKLMLQPKVGRLWATNTPAGRDAAREFFSINAKDLADEIKS
eukprot:CAMPEP_0116147288 /NCGR_PEP_ID=MMETSP0329-20121206/17673_1 /TAXON_ID=697910 /ORGANISM="Pseudo-nitzschia arenysensis, Strain B593" /LENGTH=366 /DNA_ID=CAMNT_0003643203 /DNA_START=213 /DNA_END=1309 /DNA_ORIENTATION=-